MSPPAQRHARRPRAYWTGALLAGALLAAALAAGRAALTDSPTFDEISHLPAGASYWLTSDFRLAPDHPPLAKLWCALPLQFMGLRWSHADHPGWLTGNPFEFGRDWYYSLATPRRALHAGRAMMIAALLATIVAVFIAARRLAGAAAGVTAAWIAALSPELLAHGHYVTTDLPITLCFLLLLLTLAQYLHARTWAALIGAGAALGAATATKLSWPVILPAVVMMLLMALWRHTQRLRLLTGVGLIALVALLVLWAAYGGRRTIFPVEIATAVARGDGPPVAYQYVELFNRHVDAAASDETVTAASPSLTGRLTAAALRFAVDFNLLPDGYVVGVAMLLGNTAEREAFLCGAHSRTGWRHYFPLVFLIKTPLATFLLTIVGTVLLFRGGWIMRPAHPSARYWLAGALTFFVTYWLAAIGSTLNIGHRHLLPIYPLIYVIGGVALARPRTGAEQNHGAASEEPVSAALSHGSATSAPAAQAAERWRYGAVGAALVWLLAANVQIHPHYLAYFNEAIGGPANGAAYVVDSNIDWGQDLERLRSYLEARLGGGSQAHPATTDSPPRGAPIRLAYFGSADPRREGLNCAALPSYWSFDPPAELTPGLYVISETQAAGVYEPLLRAEFWNEQASAVYRELSAAAERGVALQAAREIRIEALAVTLTPEQLESEWRQWRAWRLVSRLAQRPPTARVGYSLRVYELTAEDISELTRP